MTSNVAASVRDRLLNKAKRSGADFQLLLVRYACERFLYRLGMSEERERCILKGATLLSLWMAEPYRTTRDVDLLATGENDEEAVRQVMTTICNIPCLEDGLAFEIETLRVSPIRDDQRYGGQRAKLRALLGKANIFVQVDFGFGDVVTPSPEEAQLPTLIDGVPAPVLHTYPQVTTIAEKFEAMVQLGTRNSRMKDYFDIWALSKNFAFDGAELQQAVALCFERRVTHLPAETPEALAPAFYSNSERQELWQAYGRRGELLHPPPNDFGEVGSQVQSFLGPVYASILANETFDLHWPATGPWQMQYKPYPAYKASGVEWLGEIPAHWDVKRLKHLGDLQGGAGFPHEEQWDTTQEYPFFKVGDMGVEANQREMFEYQHTVSPDTARRLGAYIFPPSTIVYAKVGAALMLNRRRMIVRPSCIDNNMMGFIPRVPDPDWMLYWLSGLDLRKLANPGAVPSVNEGQIREQETILPPLAEQRAIATFLDRETTKIDALVSKKERLIELLQEKRTALISRTVTKGLNPNAPMKDSGVEWLGEIPAHWEVARLKGNVANIKEQTSERGPDEIYLTLENVESWTGKLRGVGKEASFDSQVKRFQVGDVLFGKLRPYLAKVTFPNCTGVCVGEFLVLRCLGDSTCPSFLEHLMRSKPIIDAIDASTFGAKMPRADWQFIGSMALPVPPLAEQRAIAAFLNQEAAKLDSLIAKVHRARELLKELRTALISAAVTGKIDVREETECT